MTERFKVESESIGDAPKIEFHFDGATCKATLAGAELYAEMRDDGGTALRIRDAEGELLADIVLNPRAHRDATENLIDIGSALLWSHWRWTEVTRGAADPKASA